VQGSAPLLAGLAELGYAAEADRNGDVRVSIDRPREAAPEVLRRLLGVGLDVYTCEPVEASLSDLFLEVVRE
jgi:hypothetical protein